MESQFCNGNPASLDARVLAELNTLGEGDPFWREKQETKKTVSCKRVLIPCVSIQYIFGPCYWLIRRLDAKTWPCHFRG